MLRLAILCVGLLAALLAFQLAAVDTVTLLSEGVVEARNASGDLIGFERAHTISRQSAKDIAAAAQAFGQNHDITVLTVQFASPEALLA